MNTVIAFLAVVAVAGALPLTLRRGRSFAHYSPYPEIYSPVETVYAPYSYPVRTVHRVPVVSRVHTVQPPIYTVSAPAPHVQAVYETVQPSSVYPTYEHTSTQVHTATADVYHVATPLTVHQTLQTPTQYRTVQYNTVHTVPTAPRRFVNGIWC